MVIVAGGEFVEEPAAASPDWAEMPTMNQWKGCAHCSHVFTSFVDFNKHLLEKHGGEWSLKEVGPGTKLVSALGFEKSPITATTKPLFTDFLNS